MVKLTRIYTRGGDGGTTSIGNGDRVDKHDLRIHACGTVDEANAAIGVVRLHTEGVIDSILARIQNDLFDLGADLCIPGKDDENLRVTRSQIDRLESEIDQINSKLDPLNSFVLPGGTTAATQLHVARTITRRAERIVSELAHQTPINPRVLMYLNRLSDHLFVLSQHLNAQKGGDILWQPGVNRGD